MNSFHLLKSFQNNQTNNQSPSLLKQKAQLSNQIRPNTSSYIISSYRARIKWIPCSFFFKKKTAQSTSL